MQIILLSLWCTSCRQWQIGKNFSFKKVFSDQYGALFSCSVQIFHPKCFCPAYQRFLKK